MLPNGSIVTLLIFTLTISVMLWKPRGLNETIPTAIGAALLLLFGIVPLQDIISIFNMISGASITILATIVMTIVLESVGFFQWAAINIISRSRGSGKLLFFYILTLCFLVTIFFNNDGSILITTPIIIHIVKTLRLRPHQQIPYLISGALVATAASAPIAVSNIANLIALEIVGLDLNGYVNMIFVPSIIGIITMGLLLFIYFKEDIPERINISLFKNGIKNNPLSSSSNNQTIDWKMFYISIIIIVIIRVSYFTLTPLGVPLELISVVGAVILISLRYFRYKKGWKDIILKTPWHILLFAFSMYVIVFALQNVGLTTIIVDFIGPVIESNHFNAIMIMGVMISVLSNIVNNLPSIMIGTLALTSMDIDLHTTQISYLASILGSDIGSLLTPIGTLATLIWMFILRKNNIDISWGQYLKVTIMVIPITLFVSLILLYLWTEWIIL